MSSCYASTPLDSCVVESHPGILSYFFLIFYINCCYFLFSFYGNQGTTIYFVQVRPVKSYNISGICLFIEGFAKQKTTKVHGVLSEHQKFQIWNFQTAKFRLIHNYEVWC